MADNTATSGREFGYVLMIATWLCWGFSYPATAILLRDLDVWSSRFVVIAASAIILLALGYLQGAKLTVHRKYWLDLIIAGILNMAIFQVSMTFGVHLLSAGRTSVIVYTMPLWASIFAVFFLNERMSRPRVIALVLGLSGLVVLMSQDLSYLRNAYLGAGLTLLSAISFGLGTVWMKRRIWNNDPTVLAGWQLAIAALPVATIWSVLDTRMSIASISLEGWLALGYVILAANAIAYFAWFRVVAAFPAVVSGISSMAVPLVGVLASAWILGEDIGLRELLALILIVGALAINLATTLQHE